MASCDDFVTFMQQIVLDSAFVNVSACLKMLKCDLPSTAVCMAAKHYV